MQSMGWRRERRTALNAHARSVKNQIQNAFPRDETPVTTLLSGGGSLIALMALVLSFAWPAQAQVPAQDYFKGKTIRLVVGTPPGGGYDTYGRLVARHLAESLPGRPTVIVVNMAGASGMNAVTWLYTQAPRDGSTIATFNKSMPFYQALGQQGVHFKTEELSWIGSLSQDPDVVSVWHKAGVKTIDDAKTRQVVMGANSGGTMTLYPALLNATLGTRFKIVTGYPGSAAVYLAVEKGEVDGAGSSPWSSWKVSRPQWVRDKQIIPLVQVGLKQDKDLVDVPRLIDLAQNDEQQQMFSFVSAPAAIERPYAGPPGMPAEALAIYRRAFAEMVKDSKFREEVLRLNLDLDPQSGSEVAKIVSGIVTAPPAIVAKVKTIADEGR
jgi:tripartite-type tricarboxylate transporter receptor subunit TctC